MRSLGGAVLLALLASPALAQEQGEAPALQIVQLPGIPDRMEIRDGKGSLTRLRIRLEDGSWVKPARCADGLCVEALDRSRQEARPPQGAMPGTLAARGSGSNLRLAFLAEPAMRLRSGTPVAGTLVAVDRLNTRHELKLAFNEAFTGDRVLIADVDQDGEDEIVAAFGKEGEGRSLAVIELRPNGLVIASRTAESDGGHAAVTLGPAADLDGDGRWELTFLSDDGDGASLEIWRLSGGALEKVAALAGFADGAGGLVEADASGERTADLVAVAQDRASLKVVSIVEDEVVVAATIALPAEARTDVLAVPFPGRARPILAVGLADGTLALVK